MPIDDRMDGMQPLLHLLRQQGPVTVAQLLQMSEPFPVLRLLQQEAVTVPELLAAMLRPAVAEWKRYVADTLSHMERTVAAYTHPEPRQPLYDFADTAASLQREADHILQILQPIADDDFYFFREYSLRMIRLLERASAGGLYQHNH